MSENIIEIKDLSKSFDDKQILKNINLSIKSGRIVGLLGKNGSGKTTLLKLINDLLVPTSGEILVDGKKVGVESKKIISFLPEKTYFNKELKIRDVLNIFIDFYEDFDVQKAKELLKSFNLDENMQLSKISKGMKEKVQLALVLSRKAKIYILDEPLGGVDPASREYIIDTILKNLNEGSTLLISTHLISDIEKILDDVIIIDNGEIILAEEAKALTKKENATIDEIFRRKFYVKETN